MVPANKGFVAGTSQRAKAKAEHPRTLKPSPHPFSPSLLLSFSLCLSLSLYVTGGLQKKCVNLLGIRVVYKGSMKVGV